MSSSLIQTNIGDLVRKYQNRVKAAIRIPQAQKQILVLYLEVRKANLERMIYQRSPYQGTSRPLTRRLYNGEKIFGDMVINDSGEAEIRRRQKGNYAIAPSMSRDANWIQVSNNEILPVMRTIYKKHQDKMISGT